MTRGFKGTLELLDALLEKKDVVIDEFQNTRLPQYHLDVVGYMQNAVESLTCPHFVTGSVMSILGNFRARFTVWTF